MNTLREKSGSGVAMAEVAEEHWGVVPVGVRALLYLA